MDEKDRHIAELEAALKEQMAISAMPSEVSQKLQARIAELGRRLGLNRSNSSKPPNSDRFGKKPAFRNKPFSSSLRDKGRNSSSSQKAHKENTFQLQIIWLSRVYG